MSLTPWANLGCTESLYRELRAMHPDRHRTPIRRYRQHQRSAAERGIPFELTLEQWWQIWSDSGHYAERGPRRTQYNMARKYDQGGYSVGNVEIVLSTENQETRRWVRKVRKTRVSARKVSRRGSPKPEASYGSVSTLQMIRDNF